MSGRLDAEGTWCQSTADLAWANGKPALFLDRDGVVLEEVHYLSRVEDLAFIPGAVELIAEANRRGVPVIMVSNQAGIGRGYFGWPEFETVQAEMDLRLERLGVHTDVAFACPHYPDHPDRKPHPGMLHKAAALTGVDLHRSWVIGDKASDLEAGRAAGLCGGVLVLTGHGADHEAAARALATRQFQVLVEPSVREAHWVLDRLAAVNRN